jgi:hypothetical protein
MNTAEFLLLGCESLDLAERQELQRLIQSDKRFIDVREVDDVQESYLSQEGEFTALLIALGGMEMRTALDILQGYLTEVLARQGKGLTAITEFEMPILYGADNIRMITIKKKPLN